MITPTKGRIVLFTPSIFDPNVPRDGAPYPALVTAVHDNNYGRDNYSLNLTVFTSRGISLAFRTVLAQEGGKPINMNEAFAEWMPYQKGQAPASSAVEERLKKLENALTDKPEPPPPVDNAHVAPGCEKFTDGCAMAPKTSAPPKLTQQDIESVIVAAFYVGGSELYKHSGSDAYREGPGEESVRSGMGCLTICTLVLKNGFTVIGKSACVSPAIFDAELGKKYAREDAVRQVWALEGYLLKNAIGSGN